MVGDRWCDHAVFGLCEHNRVFRVRSPAATLLNSYRNAGVQGMAEFSSSEELQRPSVK